MIKAVKKRQVVPQLTSLSKKWTWNLGSVQSRMSLVQSWHQLRTPYVLSPHRSRTLVLSQMSGLSISMSWRILLPRVRQSMSRSVPRTLNGSCFTQKISIVRQYATSNWQANLCAKGTESSTCRMILVYQLSHKKKLMLPLIIIALSRVLSAGSKGTCINHQAMQSYTRSTICLKMPESGPNIKSWQIGRLKW